MDKDFDYEMFQEFMRSISGIDEAIALEQRKRTFDIIETLDKLDEVSDTLECLEAVDMLQGIGINVQ